MPGKARLSIKSGYEVGTRIVSVLSKHEEEGALLVVATKPAVVHSKGAHKAPKAREKQKSLAGAAKVKIAGRKRGLASALDSGF